VVGVALLIFADRTTIIFVFFEFDLRFVELKTLKDKSTEPIFLQDMAVSNDLEFLFFLIITDSPTGECIAVQIVEIGILLLQFRPEFMVLAGVCPDSAGRLNRRNRDGLGDEATFDYVENSDL
jgi:hypothetical protein